MPNATPAADSRIEIVTPENIAFRFQVAGPFRRLPAFAIDVLIRIVIIAGVFLAAAYADVAGLFGLGTGLALICWFILSWFYGGLFEALWNGQTPGKRLFGLRVLTVDGQPINALQAVLRNVLREADAMPLAAPIGAVSLMPTYVLGLFATTLNDRFQRLGDLAAGTMVVVDDRNRLTGVVPIEEPAVVELSRSLPASFVVNASLARALAMYVGRRRLLTPARRMEIARALGQPLAERLQLPHGVNYDLLLTALYHRTFVADDRVTKPLGRSVLPPVPMAAVVTTAAPADAGAASRADAPAAGGIEP